MRRELVIEVDEGRVRFAWEEDAELLYFLSQVVSGALLGQDGGIMWRAIAEDGETYAYQVSRQTVRGVSVNGRH